MTHTKEWKKSWTSPEIIHNKPTRFNYVVAYPKKLKLGKYIDIGAFTYIQASQGVILEDDVEIGGGCYLYSETTIDMKKGTIHIKKNAKIGAHCVIMPGVTIGENSIIGACSFVNKDIPDNVIAFGVPCKVVKERDKMYKTSRIKNLLFIIGGLVMLVSFAATMAFLIFSLDDEILPSAPIFAMISFIIFVFASVLSFGFAFLEKAYAKSKGGKVNE